MRAEKHVDVFIGEDAVHMWAGLTEHDDVTCAVHRTDA